MHNPLLSICIPTYNRSVWLDKSLMLLIPQLKNLGDNVELIVSNNASTDSTKKIIDKYITDYPIKYNENIENIGALRNIYTCLSFVCGKYVWILGDDDFVLDGFLVNLLDLIKENQEIPFYYVKNLIWSPNKKYDDGEVIDIEQVLLDKKYDSEFLYNKIVYLSYLALPINGYFNALSNIIMYRTDYISAFSIGAHSVNEFTSIESTFPHSYYIANNLLDKPCIHITSPGTLCSHSVSWRKYYEITYLKWYPELFMLMAKKGANKAASISGRRQLFSYYNEMFPKALTGKIAHSQYFSTLKFVFDNFLFKEFWLLVLNLMLKPRKGPLSQNLY